MKKLPLILAIFNILFVIHFAFISGRCYPVNQIELKILYFNMEYDFWPFTILPFVPIVFYIINKLLKIKSSYNIITIIIILVNLILFILYEGNIRPY